MRNLNKGVSIVLVVIALVLNVMYAFIYILPDKSASLGSITINAVSVAILISTLQHVAASMEGRER
jgi:hypothetical protein